ncbi:MAG: hypothetical protein V7K40_06235 [Nostoc sp.]|uniref:hypothetical protein n=1 Tax=Nostoc sp. TaxID=1180 RepID=UPI002FFBD40D
MNYLKHIAVLLTAVAVSTSSFNSVVFAQSAEKFVNVGYDSDGDPFLLDATSMRKREPGFGSVLKVYQMKNGLMSEILVRASCGDETLSIVGFRTYSQGVKLTEEKIRQQVAVRTDSPASLAMSYHCHAIGARGW